MSGKKDLRELLAHEAELFEEQKDVRKKGGYVRPLPPRTPSQIYTVRVPVDRVEELRRLADARGVRPSVLVRQWLLEKLDEESRREIGEPAEFRAELLGVRRDLDRLITGLETEQPSRQKTTEKAQPRRKSAKTRDRGRRARD